MVGASRDAPARNNYRKTTPTVPAESRPELGRVENSSGQQLRHRDVQGGESRRDRDRLVRFRSISIYILKRHIVFTHIHTWYMCNMHN